MKKVTTWTLPKRGGLKCYLSASDWHTFDMHEASYSILKQRLKLLPKGQRNLIINGDFLDLKDFMFKKAKFQKMIKQVDCMESFFVPSIKAEFEWGNSVLDELEKICDEIIFICGNHDDRATQFKELCDELQPAYSHNFSLELGLKLHKRKIPFISYNDWLDIGKLSITHGMFHGSRALHKHSQAAEFRNVLFGHVHKSESVCFMSRSQTRKAWSQSCMSNMNPDYIKNSDNNWTNGFVEIWFRHDGTFNLYTLDVIDGSLVLPGGKVLNG